MKEEGVDGEVVGAQVDAATAACISGAQLEATSPGDAAAVGEAWWWVVFVCPHSRSSARFFC